MGRSFLATLALLLLLLLTTGESFAHSFLERTEPGAGNTVAAEPQEVTLWFNQKLEPAFSSVTVTNAAGERIDSGKPSFSGNQMSVSLRKGGSGTYHVNWKVLSVDTHTTDGSFTFEVGQ